MVNIKPARGVILIIATIMLAILTGMILLMGTNINQNVITTKKNVDATNLTDTTKHKIYFLEAKIKEATMPTNSYNFLVNTFDPAVSSYNITYSASTSTSRPIGLQSILDNLPTDYSNISARQTSYTVQGIGVAKYNLNINTTSSSGSTVNKNLILTKTCPALITSTSTVISHRLDPSTVPGLRMEPLSNVDLAKLDSSLSKDYPNLYCTCKVNATTVPTLRDGSCVVCEDNYYFDSRTTTCRACPAGGTCRNGLIDCGPDKISSTNAAGDQICVCTDRSKYLKSGACTTCPAYAICDGRDDFTCPAWLNKNNIGDACVCNSNQFIATTPNPHCENCPAYGICDSSELVCPTGFNKVGNTCACSGLIIGSGTNAVCSPCPAYAICSNGVITSCINGWTVSSNACVCNGYITGTGTSAICNSCSTGCSSCSSATTCYACNPGFNLYNNACVSSCPAGTYVSIGSCLACPAGQWSSQSTATSCTACTSSSVTSCSSTTGGATGCASNYQLSGTSGISGTTCVAISSVCTNEFGQQCEPCTCNGLYIADYITATACEPCTYSSPTSLNICTPCPYGYNCRQNYNPPYGSINTRCTPPATCPANCQSCSSGSTCTQCNSGYYLSNNNCCGMYQFFNGTACQDCPPRCGSNSRCQYSASTGAVICTDTPRPSTTTPSTPSSTPSSSTRSSSGPSRSTY